MKRPIYLILIALLFLLVSCAGKGNYLAHYMTYDAVDVHLEPSESSPVTMKLICDRRPSSYNEKTAEIPYAFIVDDKNPIPLGIKKFDETGKWGYFEEKVPLILDWKGWVKLSEMIPCGVTEGDQSKPTYECKKDWVEMYKHPKVNEKDKLVHKLKIGDKVLVHKKQGGWAFVEWVRYAQSGSEMPKYGWVQLKNFTQAGEASYDDLKADAYTAMQERTISNSGTESEFIIKGIRHATNLKAVVLKLFKYGSALALLFALILVVPAFRRRCWVGAAVFLPSCAIMLYLFSSLVGGPGIVYGVLVVMLVFSVLYPLVFTKASRAFVPVFYVLALGGAAYVMGAFEIFSGKNMILHIVLFIAYMYLIYRFVDWVARWVGNDVCPYCGFYAGHDKLGEEYVGTTSETTHHTDEVFDHTSRSGNTITDWYKTVHYDTTIHTDHYSVGRRCARCLNYFENDKAITRKEYN